MARPRPESRPEPIPRGALGAPPAPGEWLLTTREGAEIDLVEELALGGHEGARVFAPALVAARRVPRSDGRATLTFARQGFQVDAVLDGENVDELRRNAVHEITKHLAGAEQYVLHVWVPDATKANPLAATARAVEEALKLELQSAIAGTSAVAARELGSKSVPFVQVCLLSEQRAALGVLRSDQALSLAHGGRLRVHVGGDKPSRAARKVAEALTWLGVAPEPGERCVDLGAAPGGWTWFLLQRRARVIAVDPARLRPDLLRDRGLTYVGRSAFEFIPDEPVDWLFCDMAWRPLEVAQMLARWARKHAASLLVANFKMPMKKKAEMVAQIRRTLEDGGWRAVKTRQLYHDRDEVTVTARLLV